MLASTYFGIDVPLQRMLNALNLAFAVVFTAEAVVKLAALGVHGYFQDNWNRFDFCVVIGSDVGAGVTYAGVASIGTLASVFRAVRVLRYADCHRAVAVCGGVVHGVGVLMFGRRNRVLRLVQTTESLQVLFTTMLVALPSLINVGVLLVLLVFVFAIVGMQLFGNVMHFDGITHSANFESFGNAFVTLVGDTCTLA